MASKIADLLPAPVEVAVGKGKLVLRHLELSELVELLYANSDAFLAIYLESESENPNYMKFLTIAPALCARAIAMAADDVDSINEYRKLPFSVQLIALKKLWEVSVPDPKEFGEMLRSLMIELKRLSEQVDQKEAEVEKKSQ